MVSPSVTETTVAVSLPAGSEVEVVGTVLLATGPEEVVVVEPTNEVLVVFPVAAVVVGCEPRNVVVV